MKQRACAAQKPTALVIDIPKGEVPLPDPTQLRDVTPSGDANRAVFVADTELAPSGSTHPGPGKWYLSETLHSGFGGNNGGCNRLIVLLV
jgi:hypothetical protein